MEWNERNGDNERARETGKRLTDKCDICFTVTAIYTIWAKKYSTSESGVATPTPMCWN